MVQQFGIGNNKIRGEKNRWLYVYTHLNCFIYRLGLYDTVTRESANDTLIRCVFSGVKDMDISHFYKMNISENGKIRRVIK